MRAPTEILGIRYFLLGVIFTRTNTRVESSHQGTPQNKNKSFSLSFPDCQSLWAGSAYITLGVASAFGPDHYILPHITQRIQAASAFQAGPHFISYPGAVPTISRLHRHGIPLLYVNVWTPREQQFYILRLLVKLFEHLPDMWMIGCLYNIGCQID